MVLLLEIIWTFIFYELASRRGAIMGYLFGFFFVFPGIFSVNMLPSADWHYFF
jgi:hypothetical protein